MYFSQGFLEGLIFLLCHSVFFLLAFHVVPLVFNNLSVIFFSFLSSWLPHLFHFCFLPCKSQRNLCYCEMSFTSIVYKNAKTFVSFALLVTFTWGSLKSFSNQSDVQILVLLPSASQPKLHLTSKPLLCDVWLPPPIHLLIHFKYYQTRLKQTSTLIL